MNRGHEREERSNDRNEEEEEEEEERKREIFKGWVERGRWKDVERERERERGREGKKESDRKLRENDREKKCRRRYGAIRVEPGPEKPGRQVLLRTWGPVSRLYTPTEIRVSPWQQRGDSFREIFLTLAPAATGTWTHQRGYVDLSNEAPISHSPDNRALSCASSHGSSMDSLARTPPGATCAV